jgi:hypothetical protein
LVPPWNQISDEVLSQLPSLGFIGVSRFGNETKSYPCKIANCHLDLLKWKPAPHFAGEEKCLKIILNALEQTEIDRTQIGILTHHQEHQIEIEIEDFLENSSF